MVMDIRVVMDRFLQNAQIDARNPTLCKSCATLERVNPMLLIFSIYIASILLPLFVSVHGRTLNRPRINRRLDALVEKEKQR
jgi:hypothetical protein